MENTEENKPSDFIRDIVAADVAVGKYKSGIVTRFPPEPNGYLHIGHAKSICLNFGIARENQGRCNLRMDDTNPTKEDVEYVDSITADVRWLIDGWAGHCLGFKPKDGLPEAREVGGVRDFFRGPATTGAIEPFFASDYFGPLYEFAVELIKKGKAYVCDLSPEETDRFRGAPDKPGIESPFRNRSVEESLDLFRRMKEGEFPDGTRILRAKIDMAAPNVWLRDPVLYRIRHAEHHHTGKTWCIYPMYDFAHCLSDYIEGITHSICTLEFEVHRPLYDWILEALDLPRPLPHQYEFARLNLTYTVMSKRKLLELVQKGLVSGWDDPRMPTISGMRRRGYPAAAIREFCRRIGVGKVENMIELSLLEFCIREELNRTALRVMTVLKPLKVVIENYPEGQSEELDAVNNPEDPSAGTRKVPFGRELYIEQDDFREDPPKEFFRLAPGREVRLRYAYFLRCERVVKDPATGEILELRCTYDPATRGGNAPDGRKVKATIHWVSAVHAMSIEARLYDRLFTLEDPARIEDGKDYKDTLNTASLTVVPEAKAEPALAAARPGEVYQFERLGYYCVDPDTSAGRKVFNRTVTLKDEWAKLEKRAAGGKPGGK
ncbi:MAG: glutamine--tRNA ligase/YqeY domain fusion protein [Candidatus Omnitrophica bacterium]|nr:glutamine--tRNA ligase/YqeY domain fusion protein [Candidatus Omnitrophota bacterium]